MKKTETPKLNTIEKVVVNVGLGKMSQRPNFEEKILPEVMKEVAAITGQKPAVAKAKKSIAGFKLRTGQVIGLKVTLRKKRMNDFLERFKRVVLPRLRDFRGISQGSVDKSGNLTIGLREYTVFPEINQENSKYDFGVEITMVSKVRDRNKAVEMFREIGIPLQK